MSFTSWFFACFCADGKENFSQNGGDELLLRLLFSCKVDGVVTNLRHIFVCGIGNDFDAAFVC